MLRLGRRAVAVPRHGHTHTQKRKYTIPTPLLEDLEKRGFIHTITKPEKLAQSLTDAKKSAIIYAGIDPTGPSLHVGHLLPMMCLFHFQLRGFQILPLIGEATAQLGDPSGRTTPRSPHTLSPTLVATNTHHLTHSLRTFFTNALTYASTKYPPDAKGIRPTNVISNLPWHGAMKLLDFLGEVGGYVRVGSMLGRDSVKNRLGSPQGLSYTEFTYQLLQAYDFYHLYRYHRCTIQVGGSDQWGNIVAGLELIRSHRERERERERAGFTVGSGAGNGNGNGAGNGNGGGNGNWGGGREGEKDKDGNRWDAPAYGIATPLLTTATGEKFGKSAGNAVWLDRRRTSVSDFYQFFLRTSDADVEKYLKLFTLLDVEKISEMVRYELRERPEKRVLQRLLADEVTLLVHGARGVETAHLISRILFDSDYTYLSTKTVLKAFQDDPRLLRVKRDEVVGRAVAKVVGVNEVTGSISAAKHLITSGGLYLNNLPITDVARRVMHTDLIDGRIFIIRTGKDNHRIFVVDPDFEGGGGEGEGEEALDSD